MIGQVLAHYRLLERIGGVGMGEVFRARDDRPERDVALKIIHPASSTGQDRIRRFEQEARAGAALSHPNILCHLRHRRLWRYPYIVSELLEGRTLRQRLFEGPLPERQAADYALQVISAHTSSKESLVT
jgi:serine/threonine protein kinase